MDAFVQKHEDCSVCGRHGIDFLRWKVSKLQESYGLLSRQVEQLFQKSLAHCPNCTCSFPEFEP